MTDILMTPRRDNRGIMQTILTTSRSPAKIKWHNYRNKEQTKNK